MPGDSPKRRLLYFAGSLQIRAAEHESRRERCRPVLDTPARPLHWYLRHPQILATYAVGFCMLCTQVAMFTYVPFRLAAAPFSLSTAALGLIFLTYTVGAVVTPFAGRGIDVYGHRTVLVAALALCATVESGASIF